MVRSLVSIPYPIGYLISFETLQGIQRHPNPNSLTNANIMETVRESTIFLYRTLIGTYTVSISLPWFPLQTAQVTFKVVQSYYRGNFS